MLARRTYRIGRELRYLLPAFLIAMVISFSALPLRAAVEATIGLIGLVVGLVVLFLLARLATVMRQYRRAFRAAHDETRRDESDPKVQ